jgi:putative transcriptional regulator
VGLARFVRLSGMDHFKIGDAMPVEDRIERIAKLVLVALLMATLGWSWVRNANAQAAQDEAAPLILVAKPGLRDEFFGATILIAKPVGNGRHFGFVINRPTELTLGKLFPEHGPSQKVPDPVYLGGPLNTDNIFALVQSEKPLQGEVLQIARDLYIAIDAKTVDGIIEGDAAHARFFAGVVSWRPGELQEELRRGLWYVLEPDSELVMRKRTEGLWEELVRRSERRANTI